MSATEETLQLNISVEKLVRNLTVLQNQISTSHQRIDELEQKLSSITSRICDDCLTLQNNPKWIFKVAIGTELKKLCEDCANHYEKQRMGRNPRKYVSTAEAII